MCWEMRVNLSDLGFASAVLLLGTLWAPCGIVSLMSVCRLDAGCQFGAPRQAWRPAGSGPYSVLSVVRMQVEGPALSMEMSLLLYRFLNTKATKYLLRNNKVKEAEKTIALFTTVCHLLKS